MSIDYLNLSSARDLKSWRDYLLYRFFEILPGFISWLTICFALVFSWRQPFAVAVFIIIFDLYWLLRVLYLSLHQISSYRKMKENSAVDWFTKLKKEKVGDWQKIGHLVFLPLANENENVARATLQSLAASEYDKNKIFVVFALEGRAGKKALAAAQSLVGEWSKVFGAITLTVHPDNIAGDIAGKGSNIRWAVGEIQKEFLPKLGIADDFLIASIFDIDTKPYPQYFACLAWHYLNAKDPLNASFQPIPVYNNNIWDASAVARIIATSSTFWQMMQQERTEQLVTFSSHSMSFKSLVGIGYPYNNVSDDSRIFWRAYLKSGGRHKTLPLYYPVSMDAVIAPNIFKTMVNQYKQQRRWSWGVENLPYVMFNFLRNPTGKNISWSAKFFHAVTMFEGFWTWATCSILTFCLGWLPILLGEPAFKKTLLAYNLPGLTSQIMTLAMAGMVVSAIISLRLLPPRPPRYSRWKSLSMVLQWALLPVALIVFGAFPAIESQTRLMINKPLGFWVTEKNTNGK